jgi:hypothetical protein
MTQKNIVFEWRIDRRLTYLAVLDGRSDFAIFVARGQEK